MAKKRTINTSEDLLSRAIKALRATEEGKEAAMYPHIRDMFLHLGHSSADVETDVRSSSGGRPDVRVDGHDGPTFLDSWIVVEAKDEKGTFKAPSTTNPIIKQKWKYVTSDTEWFVGIDPEFIRIRRVTLVESPKQPDEDVLIALSDEISLRKELASLHRNKIEERRRLRDFREGKTTTFARINVTTDRGKRLFLRALKQAVGDINKGAKSSLTELEDKRYELRKKLAQFSQDYPEVEILTFPLRTRGVDSVNVSDVDKFREDLRVIRECASMFPDIFIIEHQLVPEYLARTTEKSEDAALRFANSLLLDETSALLLSRILLLRFFEDYEYFGEKRFLCNGGVKSFQSMREILELKYPSLLQTAYDAGTALYPTAFEVQPLDWVIHTNNEAFSRSLEHAMMLLAVFDFKTVEEELLSGVFGVFFDPNQRKRRGEHYTPPSIAQWMVKRARALKRSGDLKLLDPACGFGTFLVGGWARLVGSLLDRGGITEEEAEEKIRKFCGNDLNRFSATMCQMQLLWNLIRSRSEDTKSNPLPMLNVSAGFDSLEMSDLFSHSREAEVTPWSAISADTYPYIVGNPPWVRSERRDWKMDRAQHDFFAPVGNGNIYLLFFYRALREWAENDGIVAFVVPLTVIEVKEAKNFRNLFKVGGDYQIVEIVDFEVIKTLAFPDANVRPLILIARKRKPKPQDEITLRVVDNECVTKIDGVSTAVFDLNKANTSKTSYESVFSPDDRWLLKVTPSRLKLVLKIRKFQTFEDIAHEVYEIRRGSKIISRHLKPKHPGEGEKLNKLKYILRGVVKRGKAPVTGTFKVIKGENILPCQMLGTTEESRDPVASYSDSSIWKFPSALPDSLTAFPRITQTLVAVNIDPSKTACFDTVTLFAPDNRYSDFPFDFLVLSTLYKWFHLVDLREGIIADYFCNVYPSTVKRLPWAEKLEQHKPKIIKLRKSYLNHCHELFYSVEDTVKKLLKIDNITLSDLINQDETLIARWGGEREEDTGFARVQYGPELFDVLAVNNEEVAGFLRRVISLYNGEKLTKEAMLELPLPCGNDAEHQSIIEKHLSGGYRDRVESDLDDLDAAVASAFDISSEELAFMREDLTSDPLFRRLQQRLPHQEKTVRGLLKSLASSERYN